MRAFTDYHSTPEFTDFTRLPAGAYEITIKRAEEKHTNAGDVLCILFDISSGDYANFYMDKFTSDKKYSADAKFKGVYQLWYPNGGQYDETNKKRMKTVLERIQKSNHLNIDFTKEWDGVALKGCKAGMIFQDREWEYNGRTGITAQPYAIITLDDLNAGKFTVPEPKYLSGSVRQTAPTPTVQNGSYEDLPEDLPF